MFNLYGRFALHQEAFIRDGKPISFSEQAQRVLFWTSFNVVPALQRCTHQSERADDSLAPFTDPNLSLIQIEKSFADSTMLSPQSPKFMVRPSRRVNRNKTPERLDEGVGIFVDTPGKHFVGSVNQRAMQGMIIALFNSTCSLLSEWLAAGGSVSETTNTISQAASEWCDIFSNLPVDGISDDSSSLLDEMLAPFFRLVGQLVHTSGNCISLKQVLTKLDNVAGCFDEISERFGMTLSTILTIRGPSSVANDLVDCFLDASQEIPVLKEDSASLNYQLPETFDEIFVPYPRYFLSSFFRALVSHQQACFLLTNTLVERFPEHLKGEVHHYSAILDLKFLWLVLSDSKASTKIAEPALEMLRCLDTTVLNEDFQLMIESFKSEFSVEPGN